MIEHWKATGPDGSVSFTIDRCDPTPLTAAARRKFTQVHGTDAVTFNRIEPVNAAACDVVSHCR